MVTCCSVQSELKRLLVIIHPTPLSLSLRGGIVAWIVIASASEAISCPRSNVFMTFLQEFLDCHVVYFVDTPRNDDPGGQSLETWMYKDFTANFRKIATHSLAMTKVG